MYIAIVNGQTNQIEGLSPNETQARILLRRMPTYYYGRSCKVKFVPGSAHIKGTDKDTSFIYGEFVDITEPERPEESAPPQTHNEGELVKPEGEVNNSLQIVEK